MKKWRHTKNTSGRLKTIRIAFLLASSTAAYAQSQGVSTHSFHRGESAASVQINEIFPRAQSDIPEWFELINASETAVVLRNWHYGKLPDTAVLTQDSVAIEPNRFLVVTKDKIAFILKYPSVSCIIQPHLWLTLDNYKDTLQLWDAQGALVEQVAYQSDWFDHWTDQSLERLSLQGDGMLRDSWVLAEKPTPGQPNASIAFRAGTKPSFEIGPVPFTPNGDGKDDFLSIALVLPAVYSAAISIYGFNGKKLLDLPTTPQPSYQWDGKMENGQMAPIGPFFVIATFKNGSQTVVERKKGILWR
jgi:hypothetical protein